MVGMLYIDSRIILSLNLEIFPVFHMIHSSPFFPYSNSC